MADFNAIAIDGGKLKKVGASDHLNVLGSIKVKDGGTIGSSSDADALTIDANGNVTASQNLTVTGNFTVSGTTTTVDSTTVSIKDPVFEIGDDASDDNLDRGLKIKYNNSGAKIAFMGYDDSTGKFLMLKDATDTSSVFAANGSDESVLAVAQFHGALMGDVHAADGTKILEAGTDGSDAVLTGSASSWTTARTITLGGDLGGSVSIDGTANVTLTATVQATSIEQSMIADDAVGADQLASNAVVNASIAANAAIDIDKIDGGSCAASLSDLAQGDLLYAGDISASNAIKSITFSEFEDAIFGNVSGDATVAGGGALTLAASGVSAGSYGSASAVPVVTVNAKGLVTGVSTAAISTSFDIAADSGDADTVAGGETLTISGTANQLETTVSNNEITIDFVDSPTIGGGDGNTVTIDADLEVNDGFNIVNKIPLASGTVNQGGFVTVTLTAASNNSSMIIGMHVGPNSSSTAELAVNGTTVKGFDQSSFNAGDQLFLATDGSITKTAPTSGEIIQVGYALNNGGAGSGQMYVDIKHIMSN